MRLYVITMFDDKVELNYKVIRGEFDEDTFAIAYAIEQAYNWSGSEVDGGCTGAISIHVFDSDLNHLVFIGKIL